jgi:hypothetical protein
MPPRRGRRSLVADADRERTESAAGVELFQRYVTAGLEVCAATLRAAGSLVSAAVTNYQSVMDTALRSFPQRGPEGRAAPETDARNLPQRGTNATAAAEPAANQSEHRGSQTIDDRAVTASEDTGASGLTSGDRTASATTSAAREQAEDPEAAQEVAASAASTENVSVPTTDEAEHADGAEDADATIGEAADPPAAVHDAPPEAPAGTEVPPDEASPDPTGVGAGVAGGLPHPNPPHSARRLRRLPTERRGSARGSPPTPPKAWHLPHPPPRMRP